MEIQSSSWAVMSKNYPFILYASNQPTNQLFHPSIQSFSQSLHPTIPSNHPSSIQIFFLSICPSIHLFIHPFHPTKRSIKLFHLSIHSSNHSVHPSIHLSKHSIHFIQPIGLYSYTLKNAGLNTTQCWVKYGQTQQLGCFDPAVGLLHRRLG